MTNGKKPIYLEKEWGAKSQYPVPPVSTVHHEAGSGSSESQPAANPVRTTYLIICCLAFGLLLISGVLSSSVRFMEEPDSDDYDYDENDKYDKDKEMYEDTVRNLLATSSLLRDCGAVTLSAGLLIGVFLDNSLSSKTKLGMLIAAGLILGLIFSPGVRTEDLLING